MKISRNILPLLAAAILACDRPASTETAHASKIDFVASASPPMARDMGNQASVEGVSSGSARAGFQSPGMMIRTGDATVEVEKLDPAVVKVRALAAKVGGFITNTSTSGGRNQVRAAMLELRMPAGRYDETVTGLGDIGRVEATQTNAQDVGEEFVDVSARVENARKLETRLVALLTQRTGKLQEVLAVERELARIRTEIDQFEGRLRYLKNRVALSTLTVNLHEPQPIIGNSPGQNPIGAALRQAWRNFVGFFASLIAALGVLIPLAGLGLIAWIAFRRIDRRRSRKPE